MWWHYHSTQNILWPQWLMPSRGIIVHKILSHYPRTTYFSLIQIQVSYQILVTWKDQGQWRRTKIILLLLCDKPWTLRNKSNSKNPYIYAYVLVSPSQSKTLLPSNSMISLRAEISPHHQSLLALPHSKQEISNSICS